MDAAAFKGNHCVVIDKDATAHLRSGVAMDAAAFKVSNSIGKDVDTAAVGQIPRFRSSCNVQPNQLDGVVTVYLDDPAPTLGIEHHTSGYLRLNGQGAAGDADRCSGAVVRAAGEV